VEDHPKYYPDCLRKPFLEKDWANMFCPGCLSGLATDGKELEYEKHHIFPLRHFKDEDEVEEYFILCVKCHDKLEAYIKKEEKKSNQKSSYCRTCHKPNRERKIRLPKFPNDYMYKNVINKFFKRKMLI